MCNLVMIKRRCLDLNHQADSNAFALLTVCTIILSCREANMRTGFIPLKRSALFFACAIMRNCFGFEQRFLWSTFREYVVRFRADEQSRVTCDRCVVHNLLSVNAEFIMVWLCSTWYMRVWLCRESVVTAYTQKHIRTAPVRTLSFNDQSSFKEGSCDDVLPV